MKLYIMRHADAGDPKQWQIDDAARPLSALGQKQAGALGEAFKKQGIVLQAVVSSPLVRTRQTAEGIMAALGIAGEPTFLELLEPGAMRPRKLSCKLAELKVDSVAIVGHDPDMPNYLCWLLGLEQRQLYLEKCAAALVQFEADPDKGEGTLGWIVTPEWFI